MSLAIQNLSAWYNQNQVLHNINIFIANKEIHCLVGESGSGKSTILKILFANHRPTEKLTFTGEIYLNEKLIAKTKDLKNLGRLSELELIFQEPSLSFNPNWTLGEILLEPLELLKLEKESYYKEMKTWLEKFEISQNSFNKSIQNFSGGEKQRIAIIRAILANPTVLCMDEPVSGLDKIMLTKTVEYIKTLRDSKEISIFIVSHDLDFVQLVCDKVSVIQNGRILESQTTQEFFMNPKTFYTKELLESRNLVGIRDFKKS